MREDCVTRQIRPGIMGIVLLASCTFILGACAESPTETKVAASPPSTGYDAGGYTIVITPPTGP
jgi:hypothetical protein